MKVARRTFEAKRCPAGSIERQLFNNDNLTSEYMPSYKYVLREDDGRPTPFTFRSKAEAEARAKEKS